MTIYLSNVVDIKACLKIVELYDFINPSMLKLWKNQNSRKYTKTITDVADRRTKFTLGISDEREREHTDSLLFSRLLQTANVFSGEMIVCSANYSREEIGRERGCFL